MISFKQYILLEGQVKNFFMKHNPDLDPLEFDDKFKQWQSLTPPQKKHIPNPMDKKYKDWSNFVDDLEKAKMVVSKTQKEKTVKEKGVEGLEKGKDYKELSVPAEYKNVQAFIPMTHEASKYIGSKYVGNCETKWCLTQNIDDHWNSYTERGTTFIYLVTPNNKYAIAYSPDFQIALFDENDNNITEIPDYAGIETALLDQVKEHKKENEAI